MLPPGSYKGKPVLISRGIAYYVISKHFTKFNARRTRWSIKYPTKVLRFGRWWAIVRIIPGQFKLLESRI